LPVRLSFSEGWCSKWWWKRSTMAA